MDKNPSCNSIHSSILSPPKRGDFASIYRNRTIDDLVISFMETFNIPGLSLAIVQAPYIPRVVGYGLASLETNRLASSNTQFNIGKLTNAFTAVAIMRKSTQSGRYKLIAVPKTI